jgi:hypothetical protein
MLRPKLASATVALTLGLPGIILYTPTAPTTNPQAGGKSEGHHITGS